MAQINMNEVDNLSDFELPDGSIYNGECIRKPYGAVELNGIGSILYPNGDKYDGDFKYGRPNGWGKYSFKNGHTHKGFFNGTPFGIGYLNENYDMAVGNFFDGRLNGWAICYRNRKFKFGYWKNGLLIQDETDKTYWIRYIICDERLHYRGNLIQISTEHKYIRFGIPERKICMSDNNPLVPKLPSSGFMFFKDGSVKIGEIRNEVNGHYIQFNPDKTIEMGTWRDGVLVKPIEFSHFQKPEDTYEEDGLEVFKSN